MDRVSEIFWFSRFQQTLDPTDISFESVANHKKLIRSRKQRRYFGSLMSHPCKHQSINATIHWQKRVAAPPGVESSQPWSPGFMSSLQNSQQPTKRLCRVPRSLGLRTWSAESHELGVEWILNGSITKFLRFSGSLFFFCFGK